MDENRVICPFSQIQQPPSSSLGIIRMYGTMKHLLLTNRFSFLLASRSVGCSSSTFKKRQHANIPHPLLSHIPITAMLVFRAFF